jgi:hypothetical protein
MYILFYCLAYHYFIPDMLLYLYILYMYCLWKSNYQDNWFNLPFFCANRKSGHEFQCHTLYVVVFCAIRKPGHGFQCHTLYVTKSRVIIFSQSVLITLTPSSKGSMFFNYTECLMIQVCIMLLGQLLKK